MFNRKGKNLILRCCFSKNCVLLVTVAAEMGCAFRFILFRMVKSCRRLETGVSGERIS